ncbi:MAG: ABC transporter permease [Candidatus Margulisiibacteriota bacterium]|jgi:putative ABC transport system permease protein
MMSFILENIKQATKALLFNKVRSLLTMLGIIIGIFSVITLVTIGEGAKSYVTDQIQSLGAGYNSFTVVSGKDHNSPPLPQFAYSDLDYLMNRVPEISDIVAMSPGSGDLTYGKKEFKPSAIIGATANIFELMGQPVDMGRAFTPAEVAGRRKVAVIGTSVARDLFNLSNPIGEKFKLRGDQYLVIGIAAPRGSIGPMDMDKRIVIPVTIAQNMMGNDKIMRLNVFPKNVDQMDEVQEKVKIALIRRLDSDDFSFATQKGLLSIINNILAALTGFVTGIAAISLIVGGIGIMNIMLVAVNERTREIGIRKAVGAKKKDIIIQFLVESMMISLVGGILGVIFGILGAFLIIWAIKGTLIIAVWAVILSTTVSALVGIFFGVYPAIRAASLDPVVALRYE